MIPDNRLPSNSETGYAIVLEVYRVMHLIDTLVLRHSPEVWNVKEELGARGPAERLEIEFVERLDLCTLMLSAWVCDLEQLVETLREKTKAGRL